MERVHELFLEAVKAALEDRHVTWGAEVSADDYAQLLELAQNHHILPMFFEATYRCPATGVIEPQRLQKCRRLVIQAVSSQSLRTEAFLELSRILQEQGIQPLVVKGIACRSLYPNPDHRASGDEDLLCPPDQIVACHKALLAQQMEPCGPNLDAYEVPYTKTDGSLYIELHKSLFPQDSDIFGPCNLFFDGVFDRSTILDIDGRKIATLGHTDHMLYLILHAFKHFLHSGFGIRQVCDLVLFANAHGSEIDWDALLEKCISIRAQHFAAALFEIGRRYLVFDPKIACYSHAWQTIQADPLPLLADLMAGGIYGSADRKRLHSSNMTLNAVSADKKGKKNASGLRRTLFPSAKSLENRYAYLRKSPWLLPVAWAERFVGYAKETKQTGNSAFGTVETGKARIKLLKKYHIID